MAVTLKAMGIFVYISVMLAFFTTTQAAQTGLYSCMETTTPDVYTMTFYLNLNGDPISRIYGGDNNGVESLGCSNLDIIAVDASGVYEFMLTLNVEFSGGVGPMISTPADCGGTDDGTKVVTWYIYTAQYGPGEWRSSIDTKFTLTCDFNSPTPLGVLFEAILNSGDFNQDVLTQTVEDVALAIFDETGANDLGANSATNPIVLGTLVRLVITLTRNSIATGVAAYRGEASGDSTFTDFIPLLDDNGCPWGSQSLISQFTELASPDDSLFKLTTDTFPIAAVPGSTSLSFRFSIYYCYDTTTAACTDYCLYKTSIRKRRAAPPQNETVGMSIKISFNSGAEKSVARGQEGGNGCYKSTGFIVALAILGMLFLVVVGFGFFACRTLMNKNRKESTSKLQMVNPNFK